MYEDRSLFLNLSDFPKEYNCLDFDLFTTQPLALKNWSESVGS
jgi:hypothetical protein